MTTRADLHRLIDALPEPVLPIAERLLTPLERDGAALYTPPSQAPVVELEPDELQAIAEARAAIAAGDVISDEDLAPANSGCEPADSLVGSCRAGSAAP